MKQLLTKTNLSVKAPPWFTGYTKSLISVSYTTAKHKEWEKVYESMFVINGKRHSEFRPAYAMTTYGSSGYDIAETRMFYLFGYGMSYLLSDGLCKPRNHQTMWMATHT